MGMDWRKAIGGVLGFGSAGSLTPFGKKLLDTWVWDVVLNSTRSTMTPYIAFATAYGPGIVGLLLTVYLVLGARQKRAFVRGARSLDASIIVMGLSGIVFVLSMAYFYLSNSLRDPIKWDLSNFIHIYSDGTPGELFVDKFYVSGKALRDAELQQAYIRSLARSNLSINLLAEVDSRTANVSDLNRIPKDARISLYNDIHSPGQKMNTRQFLLEWGEFVIVFVADGKTYEYKFDRDDVNEIIYDKEIRSQPKIEPRISWKP
jgi:hypothetical protein